MASSLDSPALAVIIVSSRMAIDLYIELPFYSAGTLKPPRASQRLQSARFRASAKMADAKPFDNAFFRIPRIALLSCGLALSKKTATYRQTSPRLYRILGVSPDMPRPFCSCVSGVFSRAACKHTMIHCSPRLTSLQNGHRSRKGSPRLKLVKRSLRSGFHKFLEIQKFQVPNSRRMPCQCQRSLAGCRIRHRACSNTRPVLV